MKINIFSRGARRLPGALLLLAAATLPLTGCDDLLSVEDVDVTGEDAFVDETAIPALQASAYADFVDAFEGLALYGGLLGDEWIHSGTFPTRTEVDRRSIDVTNSTVAPLFSSISRARAIAEFVNQRYEAVDTAGEALAERAEARSLAGLSLVLMAEHYCAGTPISTYNPDAAEPFEFGPALTREQVLERALMWFDSAQTVAEAGSAEAWVSQLGEARALMNLGQEWYDEAAALVADIPTEFVFLADHDAQSGQSNAIWGMNHNVGRWSAANNEAGEGLSYLAAEDPRALWVFSGVAGFDDETPLYLSLKYPDRPAYTPITGGVAARLIEAEAALLENRTDDFITILNDLRADVADLMADRNYDYQTQLAVSGIVPSLDPLTLPATQAERVDLLFQERAFWLWMTGHRLGDMRRLVRQYDRPVEQVFPSGAYFKGGAYGNDVNFPIPFQEENNPTESAGQCLNRDA